MATTEAVGSFPSPYEVETPPGCEGWEEMYPFYARFDEARREADEQRFWFWNSMHFPVPMPAFDAISARPVVVGKPSRAAVREMERRLGVPARDIVVVGDDLRLDVALGILGGSQTVLVRSGISGKADLSRVPERQRPDLVVDGVADLLEEL